MIEKFAACGIKNSLASTELYLIAGLCLEAKEFTDTDLIESLKNNNFGLHSRNTNQNHHLLWLWRHSAKQKKIRNDNKEHESSIFGSDFSWDDYFYDTSRGIVVDIGCGCGISLINLSRMNDFSNKNQHSLPIRWHECNFVGADLNHQFIDYANGVVSRFDQDSDKERIHFFYSSAFDLLKALESYAGSIDIIMIQFPSPYIMSSRETLRGNIQLPSSIDACMISKDFLECISKLLERRNTRLLFQTKCEDMAIYTKKILLESGDLQCLPCISPVLNVDDAYKQNQRGRPKRVDEWLKIYPDAERAQGIFWNSRSFLPKIGRTETEIQCDFEDIHVHRFMIASKKMQTHYTSD